MGRRRRRAPRAVRGARLIFRRSRFGSVVDAQLDVFLREHREIVDEAEAKLARYDAGGREDAEERYGDYVDAVETGTEILADLRDHYAASLTEADADRYRREFNRAVARRLPPFALELENR